MTWVRKTCVTVFFHQGDATLHWKPLVRFLAAVSHAHGSCPTKHIQGQQDKKVNIRPCIASFDTSGYRILDGEWLKKRETRKNGRIATHIEVAHLGYPSLTYFTRERDFTHSTQLSGRVIKSAWYQSKTIPFQKKIVPTSYRT